MKKIQSLQISKLRQIIKEEIHKVLNEGTYKPKYTESEAFKLFDYHERTGMLPDDVTKEEYNELMSYYNIKRDNDDDFTDPAGGSGIYSHI